MSKKVNAFKMGKTIRLYDLTCALKNLTKVAIKKDESLVDYFRRIEGLSSTHFPCYFDEVTVMETRVACFCSDPNRKDFSNMLVDLAVEYEQGTPLLVMDIFMSGADALYLCMVTTDINKVFSQWVSLARPCRIHIFEIEDDPKTITQLIVAPISCFIYDDDWLTEATKMTAKEQEFGERMRAPYKSDWY